MTWDGTHHFEVELTTKTGRDVITWGGYARSENEALTKAKADAAKAWSMARAFAGGSPLSQRAIETAVVASCKQSEAEGQYHWLLDEIRPKAGERRRRQFDLIAEAIALSDQGLRQAVTNESAINVRISYEEIHPGLTTLAIVTDPSDETGLKATIGDQDTDDALMLMGVWMRSIGGRSIDAYVDDVLTIEVPGPPSSTTAAVWRTSPITAAQREALRSFCAVLREGGANDLASRLEQRGSSAIAKSEET